VIPVVVLLLLIGAGTASSAADARTQPNVAPILDPKKEGLELAAKLRAAAPAENSEFSGTVEITDREGKQTSIPIISRISVGPTNWFVLYRSAPTNGAAAETLVITHVPGMPNVYAWTKGAGAAAPVQLTQPFAESDFWLLDLGLEFFHWPQQRAIRAEMTRSRPCRVLESVNPNPAPGSYARVLSWIDNETGGILQAEAYDRQGRLLKKFKLGKIQKVQDQWQVRDMSIRNDQTRRQTQLQFDLENKP
jgi:hypothetical protein